MSKTKERRIKPKSEALKKRQASARHAKSKQMYEKMNFDILVAKKKLREEDLKHFESEET
jgi:hypothetical protein